MSHDSYFRLLVPARSAQRQPPLDEEEDGDADADADVDAEDPYRGVVLPHGSSALLSQVIYAEISKSAAKREPLPIFFGFGQPEPIMAVTRRPLLAVAIDGACVVSRARAVVEKGSVNDFVFPNSCVPTPDLWAIIQFPFFSSSSFFFEPKENVVAS